MTKVWLTEDEAYPVYYITDETWGHVSVELPDDLIARYRKVSTEGAEVQNALHKAYDKATS